MDGSNAAHHCLPGVSSTLGSDWLAAGASALPGEKIYINYKDVNGYGIGTKFM